MAKEEQGSLVELEPVKQEQPEAKRSRRENVALHQLQKRREELIRRREPLTREIERLDAAILALE